MGSRERVAGIVMVGVVALGAASEGQATVQPQGASVRAVRADGATGATGSAGTTGPLVSPSPPGEDLPGTGLDIAIAIDTTGSMGPSIAQARRDAAQIVAGTQERVPGARFSIVEFKDSTDAPEYRVAQPLTTELANLRRALASLSAEGGGDSPEAYNLVFSRVVDDPAIGFRPQARRLLFVLGDAEPHGAAAAELPGCKDTSADPRQLRTNGVLSGLRRAKVTVHMILQASSASTTLRCYRSIAGLSYGVGLATATSAGGKKDDEERTGRATADLPTLIARAIGSGLPATAVQTATSSRPGDSERYGLTLVNRLPQAVRLQEVSLVVPDGFALVPGSTGGVTSKEPERVGDRLVWPVDVRLDSRRRARFAVRLRTGGEVGEKRRVPFRATFLMPDGGVFVARSRATVRVVGAGA